MHTEIGVDEHLESLSVWPGEAPNGRGSGEEVGREIKRVRGRRGGGGVGACGEGGFLLADTQRVCFLSVNRQNTEVVKDSTYSWKLISSFGERICPGIYSVFVGLPFTAASKEYQKSGDGHNGKQRRTNQRAIERCTSGRGMMCVGMTLRWQVRDAEKASGGTTLRDSIMNYLYFLRWCDNNAFVFAIIAVLVLICYCIILTCFGFYNKKLCHP